jgi:hypothetical protein
MGYETLDACLAECTDGARAELWGRRMTLGPAPEMCVLAAGAVELPEAFGAVSVPLELLWPGARIPLEQGDLEDVTQ